MDLLLVDDHPLFARGFLELARTFRPQWRVSQSGTAAAARAACAGAAFALAVIDIGLPDGDGVALADALAAGSGVRAMLLSGRDDPATLVRARASAARGLAAKTLEPRLLLERIDRVLDGAVAFDDPPIAAPMLTERQRAILALVAAGHGNKEIRYRLGIAERTVRAHLTELFQSLGVGSRMQAVIRARELGLIG